MEKLSNSLENYLETINELCDLNKGARITDIAEKLNVSKASANKAVNNLSNLGYISNEKYQLIFLTPKGKEVAHKLAHKHNAIKLFLKNALNISEKLADKEACKIEHIISDELFEAIDKYNK